MPMPHRVFCDPILYIVIYSLIAEKFRRLSTLMDTKHAPH